MLKAMFRLNLIPDTRKIAKTLLKKVKIIIGSIKKTTAVNFKMDALIITLLSCSIE